MNKFIKKAMALALAGTMTMGMSVTTLAANSSVDNNSNYTNAGDSVAADTVSINLIKDYVLGSGTAADSNSPAEDFIFTITPYGVWNAGSSTGSADGAAYSVYNMPLLAKQSTNVTVNDNPKSNTVTVYADNAQAGKNTDVLTNIQLNEYYSVGDFWYRVQETNSNTTGVFYGTNDAKTENSTVKNGDHDAIYYIHVQVLNNPDYSSENTNEPKFLRSVTMHKEAPDANSTNKQYEEWYANNHSNTEGTNAKKVNDIQNTYYAGDLSITKEVTGNAGDKDKRFEVTVTFTKPDGTIITSDITYNAVDSEKGTTATTHTIYGQNDTAKSEWMTEIGGTSKVDATNKNMAYAQVKIYVKDGDTVTFKNIPYGITYTVEETEPDDDKYTNKLVFTSADGEVTFNGTKLGADTGKTGEGDTTGLLFGKDNAATGSVSDALDVLTITNNKESVIDVGVITSNAPYVAILVFAGVMMVLYVRRRKDMIEE